MSSTQFIGIAASVFTATSLLPQLYKIYRNKEAGDISIPMLVFLFIGLVLWTWYGFLINDWILVVSNAFSLIVNFTLMLLSIIYKKRKS